MPTYRDILAGYYGFGNFGDDLFRDTLTATLSQTSWANPRVTQNQPGPGAKLSRNIRATLNLLQARSVTLGGGSILGARGRFGIRQIEMAVTSAKHIPYCAVGVGLLEGLSGRPDTLISKMSWIGLRSEAEYLEMSKSYSHLHYMSDLAYASPKILGLDPAHARSEIAIVPAGVGELGKGSANAQWLNQWIRGNIVPLMSRASGVKLLRLQPDNSKDAIATKTFETALISHGIQTRTIVHQDAIQTVNEIAASLIMLTDRLHGGIVAHICGVPFRLSKHHKKCFDLLAELGHPDAEASRSITSLKQAQDIYDWSDSQSETVNRHSDLAFSGLLGWCDHLESRTQ